MQTETLRISPKLHKAVVHLQALPEIQQEQVVKKIEELYQVLPVIKVTLPSDSNKEQDNKQELVAQDDSSKDPYTRWKEWHDEHKQFLDNDNSWADVRDKNDFGREFSWDD